MLVLNRVGNRLPTKIGIYGQIYDITVLIYLFTNYLWLHTIITYGFYSVLFYVTFYFWEARFCNLPSYFTYFDLINQDTPRRNNDNTHGQITHLHMHFSHEANLIRLDWIPHLISWKQKSSLLVDSRSHNFTSSNFITLHFILHFCALSFNLHCPLP